MLGVSLVTRQSRQSLLVVSSPRVPPCLTLESLYTMCTADFGLMHSPCPRHPTPMLYSRQRSHSTHNPIITIRHLRALHLRTRTYSRPLPATVGYPHSMTACAHNPFPSRHCPPRTRQLAQPVPREYRSLTRADTCFRRPSTLAHRHKKLSPAPMPKPVPNALHLTRFA